MSDNPPMKIGRVILDTEDGLPNRRRLIVATGNSQYHIFPTAGEIAERRTIAGSWVRFTPCRVTRAVLRWQFLPAPNWNGTWAGTIYKAYIPSTDELYLDIIAPDVRTVFFARAQRDAVLGDLAKRAPPDTLARLAKRLKGAEVLFRPREDDAFFADDIILEPQRWHDLGQAPRLRLVA